MATRREARRQALQLLYELDIAYGFGEPEVKECLRRWRRNSEEPPPAATFEFVSEIVSGVAEHLSALDETLGHYASEWPVERMGTIDRNILRLALYEMLHREDIPTNVSINEAVELAKCFGDEGSGPFVNGILAQIKWDCEEEVNGLEDE